MEGPIYKFFRFRMTEAYYQLSQTERDSLLAKDEELEKQLGIKHVVFCNSSWSNERWTGFGVAEYPNIATVKKHDDAHLEMDWFRYLEAETMLGTAWT